MGVGKKVARTYEDCAELEGRVESLEVRVSTYKPPLFLPKGQYSSVFYPIAQGRRKAIALLHSKIPQACRKLVAIQVQAFVRQGRVLVSRCNTASMSTALTRTPSTTTTEKLTLVGHHKSTLSMQSAVQQSLPATVAFFF